MSLSEGEILDGKYRIIRQIGAGGMGAVFLGENLRVKKIVAIKVLHANAGGVEDAVQRFEREAQAAGQIGSDHIVEVHDLGRTPTGDHFMVMEFLDGESLRQRFKKGRAVEPEVVAPIVCQLLEGLGAAHAAGIIHRDLKPDNIYILREKAGRKDFVKILDFGISKFLQIGGEGGAVTRTGMVMGSPNYMSPEQVKSSSEVDARSDLYTVGVILFEAVTGCVPFKANTFAELLFKIVYEPLPDPRSMNPKVDDGFASLVVKACASRREDRFQTAAELKAALEPYLPRVGHQSIPAPQRPLAPPSRDSQRFALPLPAPLPPPSAPVARAAGPAQPSPHYQQQQQQQQQQQMQQMQQQHVASGGVLEDDGARTVALDVGSGRIEPSSGAVVPVLTAPAFGALPSTPLSGAQTAFLTPDQSGGAFVAGSQSLGGFAVASGTDRGGSGQVGLFNQAPLNAANHSGSQSGGFNAAASQSGSQSGGFNAAANQSGSQSGGFNAAANQSGGFNAAANQSGGRFSSTLGPSVGSVSEPRKMNLVPIAVALGLAVVIGTGVIGFLVTRSPVAAAPAHSSQEVKPSSVGLSPAAHTQTAEQPAATANTPETPSSAGASVIAAPSASPAASVSASPATAPNAKTPAVTAARPTGPKPDGKTPDGKKPGGSDVLGY